MKFPALLFLAGIAYAQEASPANPAHTPTAKAEPAKPETVDELKKQLTEKENEINWLNQVIQQLNTKMDGMMKFYGANDTLQQLEKFKPVAVKPPEAAPKPPK